MKKRILVAVFIVGVMVTLSMFYLLGSAGAAEPQVVSPSVTVSSALSLSLENSAAIAWGTQNPGTSLQGIIQAKVVANSNWRLTVTSNTANGLEGYDGNNHLSGLRFDSSAGSPAPSGDGVTAASFGTSQTDVWPTAEPTGSIDGARVAVRYYVTIPVNQRAQLYQATHTYTLLATS